MSKLNTNLIAKLRNSGLRPTKQRIKICEILFNREKTFHFSINDLTNILANQYNQKISLATLYNTIHAFKKKGYFKAFALGAKPCDLCNPCTVSTFCQYPEKARPTLQAFGIDVQSTIDKNGWTDLSNQIPCSDSHTIGMVLLS